MGRAACLGLAALTVVAMAVFAEPGRGAGRAGRRRLPVGLALPGPPAGTRPETAIMSIHLSAADWLDLFVRYLSLSLLAVGGAIGTAPAMHRYLVIDRQWLTEPQFGSSIALAQAAPGPNVLFVALMGWNVGLNAGGGPAAGWRAYALALLGAGTTMLGMLLPSGVLTYTATRWAHRNRTRRSVRAFKAGMAPIVIGLLLVTGWLLTGAHDQPRATRRCGC
jgi:chromate transporter